MTHCIGIDIGGTTSTIAVGDNHRTVLHVSDQFLSNTSAGPDATIEAIAVAVRQSLAQTGIAADQVTDIGLSTPGPATLNGELRKTPNLDPKLWNHFPFRAALEKKVRQFSPATVHYIGDGQAAALGEYSIRTRSLSWHAVSLPDSPRPKSLFMVIVGTGLGGGEVYQGHPVRGMAGRAGHAGHIFLPPTAFRYEHDQQLVVGNAKATVESAVSLTALTHQLEYRLQLSQWKNHTLRTAPGSAKDKAKQLRTLAAKGDPLALELFQDQARALGIGLLAINYLGDYDLLVIGGGVCDLAAEVRDRYRITAENAYRELALEGFNDLGQLEFSVCGDEAPVIGALAHAYLMIEADERQNNVM